MTCLSDFIFLQCVQAASGLSNKPKVQTVDIDAADANNHLAVVEYIDEIYNYYKSAEVYSILGFLKFAYVVVYYNAEA